MNEYLGGIDDFGSVRSDINQVSEEAVQRVQENSKKAQQIAQQIKRDKAINIQLAKFLGFLMNEIQNEKIITALHRSFFTTINPQNQTTYLRKKINTPVLVGFFAPFFLQQVKEYHIGGFYQQLGFEQAAHNTESYIQYLRKLSANYHDQIPIDQQSLIDLMVLLVHEYLSPEQDTDLLREEIKQALS